MPCVVPSRFDPAGEAEIRRRLARLTPQAPARFGRLDAPRMVCHLSDAFRNALGENSVPFRGHPLANPVMRWLIIGVLPFPKGRAPTAPHFLATTPASWADDCSRLTALLDRLVARARDPVPVWGSTRPSASSPPRSGGS